MANKKRSHYFHICMLSFVFFFSISMVHFKHSLLLFCLFILLNGCGQNHKPHTEQIQTIAFGSCNKQDKDQSFWSVIQAHNPDLWLWLGDNIYADTEDMLLMKKNTNTKKPTNTIKSSAKLFQSREFGMITITVKMMVIALSFLKPRPNNIS